MTDWLDDAVRREGALMFSDHPESRHLVLYADAPDELAPADHRAVSDHLRVCDACAADLARLLAASVEHGEGDGAPARPGLGVRLARLLAPRFLVPAVSLAVAAVAVLGPQRGAEPVLPVGQAVVLRAEVERGAAPTVTPGRGGRVALTFLLPDDGGGGTARCDVRVLDGAGRTVVRRDDVPAFDAYGTFVLSLDAAALAAGPHVLVARDRMGERRFAFDLTRP